MLRHSQNKGHDHGQAIGHDQVNIQLLVPEVVNAGLKHRGRAVLCAQLNSGGCSLLDTGSRVAEVPASVYCYMPDHGGSHDQHRGGAPLYWLSGCVAVVGWRVWSNEGQVRMPCGHSVGAVSV